MVQVTTERAVAFAAKILQSLGAPERSADSVGQWLVNSNLAGHPSHGIIRLNDYANRISIGELDPHAEPELSRDDGSVVMVDGHSGFGHLAAHELTRAMVERTASHPVVVGAVINASHTGRLGEWAEQAVRSGVILAMCTASLNKTNVAAYGAREGRLGTNPIAFGVPASDGDSLMLDFATSKIAGGKIQHLIDVGGVAPPGALVDREGRPSDNPGDWLDGGVLLTFGAHKGYGINLLVSILSGCVVGQAAHDHSRGVFALALDPGVFADRDLVLKSVRTQLQRMRTTPPAPDFDRVEVPGDYERRHAQIQQGTVTIPDATWNDLAQLAQSLGVTPEPPYPLPSDA